MCKSILIPSARRGRNDRRFPLAFENGQFRPATRHEVAGAAAYPEKCHLHDGEAGPLAIQAHGLDFDEVRDALRAFVDWAAPGAAFCWSGRERFYIQRSVCCPVEDGHADG